MLVYFWISRIVESIRSFFEKHILKIETLEKIFTKCDDLMNLDKGG